MLATAITILVSPVLARLYDPTAFGVLGLVASIASLISIPATGRYELTILLPRRAREALNVLFLSVLLATATATATLAGLLVFGERIARLFDEEAVASECLAR